MTRKTEGLRELPAMTPGNLPADVRARLKSLACCLWVGGMLERDIARFYGRLR